MTGAVWLYLCLVQSKLQLHAVNMVQILPSHQNVVENSGALDSVQWCHVLLTQSYSSQSTAPIRVRTDNRKIIAYDGHLVYINWVRFMATASSVWTQQGAKTFTIILFEQCFLVVIGQCGTSLIQHFFHKVPPENKTCSCYYAVYFTSLHHPFKSDA